MRNKSGYTPFVNLPAKEKQIQKVQAGGFAIAPLVAFGTAAHSALKSFQPFTKAKNWLTNSSMFDGKRDSLPYKIAKGVADTRNAVGYGEKKKRKPRKKKS